MEVRIKTYMLGIGTKDVDGIINNIVHSVPICNGY